MDLQRSVARSGARTQGLVTRRRLAADGVSGGALARALAAGDLVRVRRRVYATQALPPLPRFLVTEAGVAPAYVRHVRAVLLSLGPQAFASERTAAALQGWGMLVEPSRTVEVGVPHGWGTTRTAGVRLRQRRSSDVERRVVLPGSAALRTTTALQTALDCAVALPLVHAVVVVDSALRSRAVTVELLERGAARLGRAEAARARRVVALCDPRAGSVLESLLRVRMVLAGFDGWTSQAVLRRHPELRVDFCFAAARVVVEVDGSKWHPDPARDQARDNALAALGWRVLRYRWADVVHDPERVLAEVAAALAVRPAAAAA